MRPKWDWLFFCLIAAIGAISLLTIFSINKNLAASQLVFWIVGLVLLWLFSHFDYRNWQWLAIIFYLGSIFALVLLLVVAEPIRGSVRWMNLGFFKFQPSEITKVASILILANFYRERTAYQFKNLLLSFLIILPAATLVLIEPDIGNTLIIIAIWFGLSFASRLKTRHLLALAILGLIFAGIFYQILAQYQKERIASFLNPQADPLKAGYSIVQSRITVGSGQLLGLGLGRGSQSQLNFLPEAESDFIFATISEQLGFLGAGILLTLYSMLILRVISFGKNTDRFGQLIIIGTASFLLMQFLINVGMNLTILPVTGITLPFVSYGGSSLISSLFLMAIVFSINRVRTYQG